MRLHYKTASPCRPGANLDPSRLP